MYKVISFDFWDTLVENKSYKEKRINILYETLSKKNQNIEYEEVCEVYKMLHGYLKYVRQTQKYRCVSIDERLNFIFKQFSIILSDEDSININREFQKVALNDPPVLKEEVREFLKKLKENYSLTIISDTGFTSGNTVREFLKFYNIYGYFDFLIFSDEIGWNKPSSNVFNKIYNHVQCKSDEILHIGDCYETDIQGAILNGVNAIYIDRHLSDLDSTLKCEHYFKVKNISDCLKIIKYEK